MSRLGKKPIVLPAGVSAVFENNNMKVQGSRGELVLPIRSDVSVVIEGNIIELNPSHQGKLAKALWGTYAAITRNMVTGVTDGFTKKLIVEGVGFKVEIQGTVLVLALGFSHPVKVEVPEGISVSTEKNTISISGINKEKVGQFAAYVRSLKKPEPYKGKGIRYEGEVIRRKEGKKGA